MKKGPLHMETILLILRIKTNLYFTKSMSDYAIFACKPLSKASKKSSVFT